MFSPHTLLQDFNPEVYLKILINIAKTDGVKEVEKGFIEDQAKMLNMQIEHLWSEELELESVSQSASTTTRRLVIRDCIILAGIDDDYTDTERSTILAIANQLGVDLITVEKLESWIERYWSLLNEIEDILTN